MYKAISVAKYIINYSNSIDSPISNLKLQKLLYYVQAAFLVEDNKKCFDDEIVAWAFGPVVPEVYQAYRVCGRKSIPQQENEKEAYLDLNKMKIEYRDVEAIKGHDASTIRRVVDAYAQIENPFELVKKTHGESPWENTDINERISCKKIKQFYTENPEKIYSF